MTEELLNCPNCGDIILKKGHCYNSYCSEHRKKQPEELKPINKAYMVYPGVSPFDDGCVLTFAESRNKARSFTMTYGPWIGNTYLEMNAKRARRFDKYAPSKPKIYDTNDGLPEPFFTETEI